MLAGPIPTGALGGIGTGFIAPGIQLPIGSGPGIYEVAFDFHCGGNCRNTQVWRVGDLWLCSNKKGSIT